MKMFMNFVHGSFSFKRIICLIFGHDWQIKETENHYDGSRTTYYRCKICKSSGGRFA